jgi:hypothetical protein
MQHSRKRFFFKKRQISSPSVWAAALGEEGFFLKKDKNLPRVLHLGKKNTREENKKRKLRWPSADDVKSSSSASTALGEAFPECTIFGTRGRRLSH